MNFTKAVFMRDYVFYYSRCFYYFVPLLSGLIIFTSWCEIDFIVIFAAAESLFM